jgi:hypothetical protein
LELELETYRFCCCRLNLKQMNCRTESAHYVIQYILERGVDVFILYL